MIEHTPIEVDDQQPQTPHAHEPPPPTPQGPPPEDVVLACLTGRLSCPVCGRVERCRCLPPVGYREVAERARLVVEALRTYHHIAPAATEVEHGSTFDPEETAQWLAARSGFPRYTQVDEGWRRLMESEIDVELAAMHAARRVPSADAEMVKAAKAALLAHHQRAV